MLSSVCHGDHEWKADCALVECIEWSVDDNIDNRLEVISQHIYLNSRNYSDKIILVGDSTGGNFACQLRDKLKNVKIYTGLVLLNPLLSLKSVYNTDIFSDNIKKYIEDINVIDDALLIVSKDDEVINNNIKKDMLYCTKVIRVDDSHKLITFTNYIDTIKDYTENLQTFLN